MKRIGEVVEIGDLDAPQRARPVTVVRYRDGHLFDALHAAGRLTDQQHAAAERLMRLRLLAGLVARPAASYGVSGRVLDADPDGRSAWDDYRDAMDALTAAQASAVGLLLSSSADVRYAMADARDGLDALAKVWGL